MKFLLLLTGFASFLAACIPSQSPLPTLPVGNVSDIINVTVSTPDSFEIDQLPTLSKLPDDACTKTKEGKNCTIDANQAIKWGWGFCKNSESALQSAVAKAEVQLVVDDVRIPPDLIYQRDEVYDRKSVSYCHTWFIKLSDWQRGSTVRLENRNVANVLGSRTNVFIINVK